MTKDALDFIVIGAQKAGTTSLFEHLRQHPEIHLPAGKEVPYFSHEAIRERGWADYVGKAFFGADPSLRWGTVTPQYMVGGLWEEANPTPSGETHDERTVPLRILERSPGVRLIAILRDPAERARAQYRMALMNQLDTRSFARAIDELLQPEALEDARREPRETTGYVAWGEYGRILAGYYDVFPRDQILVVFTEDLQRDPGDLICRIHEFLGVRPDFIPRDLGVRYRVGADVRRLDWLGSNARLHPWTIQRRLTESSTARRVWHALPVRGRRRIDKVLAQVTYRLDLWNRRTQSQTDDDRIALARLRAHYAEDADRLSDLLGCRLPWQAS